MKYMMIMVLALVFLSGCWGKKAEQEKLQGLVVINVLDKPLYDDCHIAGSIHVPFEMIEEYADRIDKDAEIVIYCSNYQCSTSEFAAQKLRDRFKKIYVYEGGMAEWFQNNLPVEGPHQEAYLTKVSKKLHNIACEQEQFSQPDQSHVAVISMQELAQKMGIGA